jgi:hypothetical protein
MPHLRQHTAKRARARKERPVDARTGRARPAAPARARAPGLAAATVALETATGHEAPVLDAAPLSDRLVSLLHGLSHSLSVLIVSVEALRRQDADADSDIAAVLQQHVGDQMDLAIEELAGTSLARRRARRQREIRRTTAPTTRLVTLSGQRRRGFSKQVALIAMTVKILLPKSFSRTS